MGIGYDDDTLIAEREEYEEKRRADRTNRNFLATWLSVGWIVLLALLYDGASGTSETRGVVVFFLALGAAMTVYALGWYRESTL